MRHVSIDRKKQGIENKNDHNMTSIIILIRTKQATLKDKFTCIFLLIMHNDKTRKCFVCT